MKRVVGVTGSMSCGKSTVCKKLIKAADKTGSKLCHINVDNIRTRLLESNEKIKSAFVKRFGKNILNNEQIDRRKLSEITFNNKKELKY